MTDDEPVVAIGEPVDEDALRNGDEPAPEPIEAPNIGSGRGGILGVVWRAYRAHRKEKRLANKGYVKWYLVGSGWPEPKFIKPEMKGGGIPEYEHDGEVYMFPQRGRLASRDSGMWTVVHKQGESDPLNLRDPTENAIKADELKEYLAKRVTSSPPSFWDKFDLDADDLIKYAVFGIIALALLQQFLGGGL